MLWKMHFFVWWKYVCADNYTQYSLWTASEWNENNFVFCPVLYGIRIIKFSYGQLTILSAFMNVCVCVFYVTYKYKAFGGIWGTILSSFQFLNGSSQKQIMNYEKNIISLVWTKLLIAFIFSISSWIWSNRLLKLKHSRKNIVPMFKILNYYSVASSSNDNTEKFRSRYLWKSIIWLNNHSSKILPYKNL